MSEDAHCDQPAPAELHAALARLDEVFARAHLARAVNASFARRKGLAGARPHFLTQLVGPTNPQPQQGVTP